MTSAALQFPVSPSRDDVYEMESASRLSFYYMKGNAENPGTFVGSRQTRYDKHGEGKESKKPPTPRPG